MQNNLNQQIFAEKIKHIYTLVPVGLIATLVNGTIVTALVYTISPEPIVLVWFAVLLIAVALRSLFTYLGVRSIEKQEHIMLCATVLSAGFALSGVIWGSAAFFMLLHRSSPLTLFVAFLVGGMAAGAAATYSALRPTYYAFILPAVIPHIILFLFSGTHAFMIIAGILLYFIVLVSISAESNRKIIDNALRLRFEKEKLARLVSDERNRINRSNKALKYEIKKRKNAEKKLKQSYKELEYKVAQRTEELSKSNKRLEELNRELTYFSHSVSHDLRSPLFSINGFSKALGEELEGKMDDTAKYYLSLIQKAVKRMGELIEDLLMFSKASQSEIQKSEVNLSEIALDIIKNLQNQDLKRRIRFVSNPQIISRCDPKLIRIVLENLLSNAWKFTGKTENPQIQFDMLIKDNTTVYYIRDNGAGFDMAEAEKLFAPFKRLHTASEFPGSGIGLATVARIIWRHGGTIWAESEIGKGATFYFTLQ
ncbi:Sensory box histidine kinase [Chitinispirillum alkaliphilum]|nr:Sensory box histidine kinase [Chitinispirillum alkaliphilum]